MRRHLFIKVAQEKTKFEKQLVPKVCISYDDGVISIIPYGVTLAKHVVQWA